MLAQIVTPNRRVFFYVDGFNFYYRRLQKFPGLKWLSIRTLADRLCVQVGRVEQIKFFTAKVDPDADPLRPTPKQLRQTAYWTALRHTGVEIIEGLLETPIRRCRDTTCDKLIRFPSEKMSDVNLALHVYRDYLEGQPDVIFVISGDCDIIPALKMVREKSSQAGAKKVMRIVCLPTDQDDLLFSRLPLHYQVARTIKLGSSDVRLSQFDDRIEISPGVVIERPDTWR